MKLKVSCFVLVSLFIPQAIEAAQNNRISAQRDEGKVVLSNSIRQHPTGVLKVLRAPSSRTTVEFQVALKMRKLDHLRKRIAARQKVSVAELKSQYYPKESDYNALLRWLRSKGLKIQRTYANHLTVEVSGTVQQVEQALGNKFSQVNINRQTYISAITAPSLPAKIAGSVLGINNLQPERQMYPKPAVKKGGSRVRRLTDNAPPYLVNELMKAYGANGLTQTGAGQTIGILIDRFPKDSDMTAFWRANNIPQSLSNIEKISVVRRIPPKPLGEESLDAQWTSGIASGAKLRIYATGNLSFGNIDKALQKIIDDLPNQPGLRQLSISLGACESDISEAQLQTDQQLFAAIASQNVSIFVSSGDDGSSGLCASGQGVSYFASDPSVTAVGGTSLKLDATGAVDRETAWQGSGGGVSSAFERPSWQVGNGVRRGSQRLVPDVALEADPETGVYVVVNGQVNQIGGTSLSAPVWAGFSALINQERIANGKAPLGLMGPRVYPLIGTSSFRDIVRGNNGAYRAKIGYDMVTGVGVPVMSELLPALVAQP